MNRILITGGGGFLGHNLVEEFRRRFSNDYVVAPSSRELDLCSIQAVIDKLKTDKIDTIIHLAASMKGVGSLMQEPLFYLERNLLINLNVIQAAQACCIHRIITVGSSCCYSSSTPVPMKEGDLWKSKPENTYGIAKLVLLELLQHQKQMDWTYLVFGNLYGPWDHYDDPNSHLIPATIFKFNHMGVDKTIRTWGDGTQIRDFLYVDDAVEVICDAYSNNVYSKQIVNVSNMEPVSVRQAVSSIRTYWNDPGVRIVYEKDKPTGIRVKILDNTRFRTIRPNYAFTLWDRGIQKTFAWLKDQRIIEK